MTYSTEGSEALVDHASDVSCLSAEELVMDGSSVGGPACLNPYCATSAPSGKETLPYALTLWTLQWALTPSDLLSCNDEVISHIFDQILFDKQLFWQNHSDFFPSIGLMEFSTTIWVRK